MAVATVFGALALFALAGPLGMFFSGGVRPDGVMLAQTLTILALSTPFMSANFMMSRVFYANEDARTPFFIQLVLALVNVVAAFLIQFLPFDQIIFAIAILYTGGNILSVIVSAFFLRRLLGHLDGPRIANSYIRMGYAALGSAIAGAGRPVAAGQLQPGRIRLEQPPRRPGDDRRRRARHAGRLPAPAEDLPGDRTAGPAAAAAGRLAARRRPAAAGPPSPPAARLPQHRCTPRQRPTPERATVSVDTGLIPRISGEFDAASFRAGPDLRGRDRSMTGGPPARKAAICRTRTCPATAQGGLGRAESRCRAARTYQGPAGQNPHFPSGGGRKNSVPPASPAAVLTRPGHSIG